MPVTRGLILLCPLIFHLHSSKTSSNDDFTCVAGNFTAGRPASVTCHFGPGVHKPGYHFEIVRYSFQASASHSGGDVLRCHRLGSEFRCTTGKGYVFDGKVEHNLTVSIPNVTHHQAGRYACQLIPPDNRKKRLCILNVKDAVPSPDSLDKSHQSPDTVMVLSVFVGILVAVCIILVQLLIFRKGKRRKRLKKRFYFSGKKDKYAASADATRSLLNENLTFRTPFIMPPILPYTESDIESETDDSKDRKGFPGDEEDARPQYKVDISLNYEVDYSYTTDESPGKRRYSGDEFDKGREAVKITIKPYEEEEDKWQVDQVGHDPPWGIIRRPRRLILPGLSSTTLVRPYPLVA